MSSSKVWFYLRLKTPALPSSHLSSSPSWFGFHFLSYVPPLLRVFYTALNLRLLILLKFYTNFLQACKFPQILNSVEQQHRMCTYCFHWLGDQLWLFAFLRKICLLPTLCLILHQNMTMICTCPVVYRRITGLYIWLGDDTRNVERQK